MPTENERKFVLSIDSQDEIRTKSDATIFMKQGYLAFTKGLSLRVRMEEPLGGKAKFKSCFKQKVNGRVIEIEKKIDRRDFDDLWSIAMNRLEKVRYVLEFSSGVWEVDYFKDHGEIYFALAEHEMPEGQLEPNKIPSIIKRHLLYEVPADDDNYSSKRLACLKHAKKLYRELVA